MSDTSMSRRNFLAGSSLMAASCRTEDSEYFGRAIPRSDQTLIFENGFEPETLDPTLSLDIWEGYIVHALFEGLTSYHPSTGEPMAGLATHYEVDATGMQFVFYLRGHPSPRGYKLPNTDTLQREFREGKLSQELSRGLSAPADSWPARWSDGTLITADDIVYSWRRAVNPATASPRSYLMSCIMNARAVMAGKAGIDEFGVKALDSFTLQVNLEVRTPFFLQLISHRVFCAVPPHAIEAARRRGNESAWIEPRHIVTSGPFTLQEWRPYDRVVVRKNLHYFESDLVTLRQISFLPVSDGAVSANIYKAGEADSTPVSLPQLIPVLKRKRDFHTDPAFGTGVLIINTTRPPFDNVYVRYALNMATDKAAIASLGGSSPTANLIPAFHGYQPPEAVPIDFDGSIYNVLAFNPGGARRMLAKAGYPHGIGPGGQPLTIEISLPSAPETLFIAQILQHQWRRALGVDITLANQELKVWIQTVFSRQYKGVAIAGNWGAYLDPTWFLDEFLGNTMATGWSDPVFRAMVSEAKSTVDDGERLRGLAKCEAYLLKAMPVIPLQRWTWCRLQKPYVRGLESNIMDARRFKYTWIDTQWRPA